jgi:hypothetical protein
MVATRGRRSPVPVPAGGDRGRGALYLRYNLSGAVALIEHTFSRPEIFGQ